MKKVSIVGTNGLPANYGGWETLVDHLTKNLNDKFDITVYCSLKAHVDAVPTINGVSLKYINLKANGWQSIPYDVISIFQSLKSSDVLLILGVSGCLFLPIIRLFSKKFIVVNIDGLEWKRAKWNFFIKQFLKISESLAVRFSDRVIADNAVIQNYIMSEYGRESELIAYGADHAHRVDLSKQVLSDYSFLSEPYAFKVCRIEPENNLDMILSAFVQLSFLNLVIIGNWDNSLYGVELKAKYSGFSNMYLLDPIYDQSILNQIRSNCFVYIHGHSAGGTNPSLVEAMFLELPILSYDVNFNRETTKQKAKYFKSVEELVDLVNDLDERELKLIGSSMKEIADHNYLWIIICEKYQKVLLNL